MLRPLSYFTLCIFSFVGISAFGQVNSYFENNPKWKGQTVCGIPAPCIETDTYMHYIEGDTILDGIEYLKLYRFGRVTRQYMDNGQPEYCTGSEIYNGPMQFIRSEDRRIYFRPFYASEEVLLYDFNLEIGDTLPDTYTSNFNEHITVTGIDSIEVGDQYYKTFELNSPNHLIEGIGSAGGLFAPIGDIFDCGHSLICYSQNDIPIYTSDSGLDCTLTVSVPNKEAIPEISIFPHPLTETSTMELGGIQGPFTVILRDITGKVVRQKRYTAQTILMERRSLQPGIYLLSVEQNGESLLSTKVLVGQ